jgi:hypothetical protein
MDTTDNVPMPMFSPSVASTVEPITGLRVGTATTPALLLGGSADVPIEWSAPMPSTNYHVSIAPATGLIGKATIVVKNGSQTTTGITVTVTAGLAVSLGAEIVAIAAC